MMSRVARSNTARSKSRLCCSLSATVTVQFPVRVVAWAVMRVTAHLFHASADLEAPPATSTDSTEEVVEYLWEEEGLMTADVFGARSMLGCYEWRLLRVRASISTRSNCNWTSWYQLRGTSKT